MPIDYRVIRPPGVVYAVFSGVISAEDIRDYRRRLRADPHFSPDMDTLADLEGVSAFEPMGREMSRIVEDDPFGPRSRHAAVAPAPEVYGMLRMYEIKADWAESRSRVFQGLPEAKAWLDLPSED